MTANDSQVLDTPETISRWWLGVSCRSDNNSEQTADDQGEVGKRAEDESDAIAVSTRRHGICEKMLG